ncbi:MAG: ATP-binding protein [Muribaculaceae bacterium]|nr:ATP-binding protein [Muribaculaceae bacterium]
MKVRFPTRNGLKSRLHTTNKSYRLFLLALFVIIVVAFLVAANALVKELSKRERERMDIWATATQKLSQVTDQTDIDLLLTIIERNNSIPVLVAASDGEIIDFRNFNLPEKSDMKVADFEYLSETNKSYLRSVLKKATGTSTLERLSQTNPHFIKVNLDHNVPQYIYYEDSRLLKILAWYPYVQMVVLLILIIMIYYGVIYAKNAEQNRLWAALSKETAHQLGTPISSLMAWNEYLAEQNISKEIISEIGKDLNRLSEIAARFSKIGSNPELTPTNINEIIEEAVDYMKTRISEKVELRFIPATDDAAVAISPELFEWVMENLIKNAVDAINGQGSIIISNGSDRLVFWIEIKDSGKGMERKNIKQIFRPGYTTKQRGWGLGLALARRIIEKYHKGRIFVKESEPGKGTIIRIEIPAVPDMN